MRDPQIAALSDVDLNAEIDRLAPEESRLRAKIADHQGDAETWTRLDYLRQRLPALGRESLYRHSLAHNWPLIKQMRLEGFEAPAQLALPIDAQAGGEGEGA